MAMTRRFLSYLPSSVYEAPPVAPATDPADRRDEELLTLVPRKRTTTFDVRRAIRLMADKDSFFEIGPLWGTDQVTGFVRFDGHPMGVIASDSRHVNGGALTADGCDKLAPPPRPLRPLPPADPQPGRQSGLRRRHRARDRRHHPQGRRMDGRLRPGVGADLHGADAPKLRRRRQQLCDATLVASARVAWPAADVGGIPPEGGIEAAYKRQLAEAGRPRGTARRDQRPHRERARPDRPAQPLRDRGDDRPARHPPAGSATGSPTPTGSWRSRRGWCRARCSSGRRSAIVVRVVSISNLPTCPSRSELGGAEGRNK